MSDLDKVAAARPSRITWNGLYVYPAGAWDGAWEAYCPGCVWKLVGGVATAEELNIEGELVPMGPENITTPPGDPNYDPEWLIDVNCSECATGAICIPREATHV